MKRIFLFCILAASILPAIVISPGCANIIPPTGGLRDSLPPVLLGVTPPDSTTNFAERKLVFSFDEYVVLDNVQQNLIVSPTLPVNPVAVHRLKTVTVTLRDTLLEPNTTYTLDFGNALRDNNEGNIFRNFKYIFSTGSYLDSLSFGGNVLLAETGTVDSTMMVILHTNPEDSAVIKERPRYRARVDRQGAFRFENLPPGEFYLYALKDESGAGRYQNKSQLFAFADEPVIVDGDTDNITLYAYVEEQREESPRPGSNAEKEERLRIQTNIRDGKLSLLDKLQISFPLAPLSNFDSTQVKLLGPDSLPLSGYSFGLDTSLSKFTVFYKWNENTAYSMIFGKDFAVDSAGRKLTREDTLRFSTARTSEYGSIKMRFLNLDLTQNPILLLIQNKEIRHTHIFSNRDFNLPLFPPGEYEMRIVFDRNQNGKWDPGNFFESRQQPERIMQIPRNLTVRANWESEIDIDLERSPRQ